MKSLTKFDYYSKFLKKTKFTKSKFKENENHFFFRFWAFQTLDLSFFVFDWFTTWSNDLTRDRVVFGHLMFLIKKIHA